MTKNKDDELGTFRISDKKRPEVRSFTIPKKGAVNEPPPSPSVGFPSVESRLEQGTIEDVAAELQPSYAELEEMTQKGDMKTKTAAKKAMAAYERTADLFEYLFETKAALSGSK